MARITKKDLDAQNQVLLNDAKGRMVIAQNALYTAKSAVKVAEAVLAHATEAYYAMERRINPSKDQPAKAAAATTAKAASK